jgi:putative heme-binding domain-containing protein
MVAERPDLALKLNIADEDANVVRAAAEALAARVELPWKLKKSKPLPVVVDNPPADWTSQERLYMLLATLEKSNEKDFLLRQAIRIAVRDLCEHNESFALPWNDLAPLAKQDLAQILLSVKSTSVAHNLRQYLNDTPAWNEQVAPILTHIARYANPNDVASIVADVRDQSKTKTTNLLPIILAVHQGLAQRGVQSPELQVWAEEVCGRVLAEHKNVELPWQNIPLPNAKDTENPWTLQVRPSADGNKEALFYSSLVKGEQKTGMNRSQPFELPRELSFWCAGHIGFPGKQTLDLNYIRLRDANNHELLAEARPPRNDMAQKIVWNLEKQAGKRGYVELIDGDAGNAYAWLAVGRFSVSELNPNDQLQQLQRVTQLIKELQLKSLLPQLTKLLVAPGTDPALRGNIATTLHAFQPDARYAAVARLIPEPNLSVELSTQLATAMTKREDDKLPRLFEVAVKNVPHRIHTQIAEILASDVAGGTLLLQLVEQGKLSPYLLRHSVVSQKMQAHAQPSWSAKIKLLTERLPAVNAELEKLLNARRQSFATAKADIATGSKIFEKHCAVCHQIGGKGAVIGPQLDGIGGRGLERILEDVLDPHRNVDVAFRTTSLTLHDGRIITGLVRREEGEQLVLVGNDGKEFRLNRTDVEERQLLTLSLMPSFVQADEKGSFVESMETNDMHHLLAFLLSQTAKHAP